MPKFKTHLDILTEETILDHLHVRHPKEKNAVRLANKFCKIVRMKNCLSIWNVFSSPVDTRRNRRNQLATQTIRGIEAAIKECHANADNKYYSYHDKDFLRQAEKEIKKRRARASRRKNRIQHHTENTRIWLSEHGKNDEEVFRQEDKEPYDGLFFN